MSAVPNAAAPVSTGGSPPAPAVQGAALESQTQLAGLLDHFGRIPSWALHRLGCFFVGHPSKLGMPDDYWYQPADRRGLTQEDLSSTYDLPYIRQLVTNFTRLLSRPRNAISAFILGFVALAAGQMVLDTGSWVSNKMSSSSSSDWTDAQREDAQKSNPTLLQNCIQGRPHPGTYSMPLERLASPAPGLTFIQGCGRTPSTLEQAATAAQQGAR